MNAAVEAGARAEPRALRRFSAQLAKDDVLHLWHKPATRTLAGSEVLVQVGGANVATLSGPRSDDFQVSAFTAHQAGEHEALWDQAETTVSVAYAYTPATVFEDGIRVLFVREQAAASPSRYPLHFAPPFGWMNDPNGLIELNGRTHLFYQHYPHARHWDTMHWGHAVSDNLVDWTHLPVFLHPAAPMLAERAKSGGAFSGSAITRADGGLRIFHTDREDRREEQEWQMTAASADALQTGPSTALFKQRPPLPGFGPDLRDPYVFKGPGGEWMMLLGGADASAALVLLYATDDPEAASGWRFVGVLHREPLTPAVPAECPCLVALDGEGQGLFALVFGLIGHRTLVKDRLNPSYALVGRFDGRRFEEIARRELDFIGDCYAFQGFQHRSRSIGFAWAANWAEVHRGQDFFSAMTFPRRMIWSGGRLLMPPDDAVRALRGERLTASPGELGAGVALDGGQAELTLTLAKAGARFRLELTHPEANIVLASDGRTVAFMFEPEASPAPHLTIDATQVTGIDVFIDVGLIEIFLEGGLWSGAKRIDSDAPVSAVRLQAEAGSVANAEVWSLRARKGA